MSWLVFVWSCGMLHAVVRCSLLPTGHHTGRSGHLRACYSLCHVLGLHIQAGIHGCQCAVSGRQHLLAAVVAAHVAVVAVRIGVVAAAVASCFLYSTVLSRGGDDDDGIDYMVVVTMVLQSRISA